MICTTQVYQSLLEEQLSDGREWLLDTEIPGLADISAHMSFSWISFFKSLKDLFDPKVVPYTVKVRLQTHSSFSHAGLTGMKVDHPPEGISQDCSGFERRHRGEADK